MSLNRITRLLILAAILAVGIVPRARSQADDVVFQDAYQRVFKVTHCSNASPIVVSIQAPAANEALAYIPLDNGSLVTISGVQGNTACNVTDAPINVLTPTTFELTGVAGNANYIRGGTGITDTLSDNLPSVVMDNVGQGGHFILVQLPDAIATIEPLQVRIEASDTCPDPPFCANGDWRPISDDITSVPLVGNVVYSLMFANGAWRAVRVNSLLDTPGSAPLRVYYTGMLYPIGSISFLGDRYELETPWGGNSYPDGGLEFVAGACQSGTAALAFNGGNAEPLPEPQCIEDDQELAVAAFDATTTECVQDGFLVAPQGTPGIVQVTVEWTAATTGTAEFSVEWAAVGPGDILGSVNWSAPTTATGTVGVANDLARTQFNVPTTGLLATQFFFYQFCRVGGSGTIAGDALVKSIVFLPQQ